MQIFKKILCVSALAAAVAGQITAKEFKLETVLRPEIFTGVGSIGPDFGSAVKKNGSYIFVTAPTSLSSVAGAVYVYKQDGHKWKQQQIITTHFLNLLGLAQVDSDGDWLMISSVVTPGVNDFDMKGSVVIYRLNHQTGLWDKWQVLDRNSPGLQRLTPVGTGGLVPSSNAFEVGANFGSTFSLDAKHGHLLVAAHGQKKQGKRNAGVVYAFDFNKKTQQWELIQKIHNPKKVRENDTFGTNIAIKGDVALMGASPIFTFIKPTSTSVYLFQREGDKWRYRQRVHGDQKKTTTLLSRGRDIISSLESVDPKQVGDGFGSGIAVNEKWALISAPFENRIAVHPFAGAFYFFEIVKDSSGKKMLKRVHKAFSDSHNTNLTGLSHVSLHGNTAAIADAWRKGPKGACQGGVIVYEFTKKGWKHKEVLYDPHGYPSAFFGGGVSVTKKHIVGGTDPLVYTIVSDILHITLPSPITNPQQSNKAILYKR